MGTISCPRTFLNWASCLNGNQWSGDYKVYIKDPHTFPASSSMSSSRLMACLNAVLILIRFDDDIGNLETIVTVNQLSRLNEMRHTLLLSTRRAHPLQVVSAGVRNPTLSQARCILDHIVPGCSASSKSRQSHHRFGQL